MRDISAVGNSIELQLHYTVEKTVRAAYDGVEEGILRSLCLFCHCIGAMMRFTCVHVYVHTHKYVYIYKSGFPIDFNIFYRILRICTCMCMCVRV